MSLNDEMHSVEELLDTALELFMELASDNLPEQEIVRFNQEFNDRGLLAETDPADDWAADVGFEVSDADYAEIWVGLATNKKSTSTCLPACCSPAASTRSSATSNGCPNNSGSR
jgi:uncharacterized protein YciU (UPF0263 family)